jgi:hypothetical protein
LELHLENSADQWSGAKKKFQKNRFLKNSVRAVQAQDIEVRPRGTCSGTTAGRLLNDL